MWLGHWPPQVWAAFGWKDLEGIPSGDHGLEGWHNRLQNHIWPKDREAADHAIGYLYEEWEASFHHISNPVLTTAREKEQEQSTNRWWQQAATLPAHAPPALAISTPIMDTGPSLPIVIVTLAYNEVGFLPTESPAATTAIPNRPLCMWSSKGKPQVHTQILPVVLCQQHHHQLPSAASVFLVGVPVTGTPF